MLRRELGPEERDDVLLGGGHLEAQRPVVELDAPVDGRARARGSAPWGTASALSRSSGGCRRRRWSFSSGRAGTAWSTAPRAVAIFVGDGVGRLWFPLSELERDAQR